MTVTEFKEILDSFVEDPDTAVLEFSEDLSNNFSEVNFEVVEQGHYSGGQEFVRIINL